MGKRQFTSQASSTRAASASATGAGFGATFTTTYTRLSFLTEASNLSSISDANAVVSFKNLSKKDETTRSKALESLRTLIQNQPNEQGGVEEAILEAWVNVYPRISIDNSRRIRELSHNVQCELLKSARKRMERYIPKIVGSWLAGTYDRDRTVARSAIDGLTSFLDTDAKMNLFWTRCQNEILEYAEEALKETPYTLSDERFVPTEDANEKYFRVNSASVSLLANLLAKLSNDDISKHQDKYGKVIFNNKKLWTLASCEDASTRKSIDKLLVLCLEIQTQEVEKNLETISRAFISKALRSSQSTSALQLLQTLQQLTKQFPQVWTSAYKGSHSGISDLKSFVRKGSQGSSPAYWQALRALVALLPTAALPQGPDSISEFLETFRKSINQREESRANSSEAWLAYGETTNICIRSLSSSQQMDVLEKSIYPVFEHYLHPSSNTLEWVIRNNTPSSIVSSFISTLGKNENLHQSLSNEWKRVAQQFITRIQTSMPEQSKDFSSSQDAVIAEGHRWFALLSDIFKANDLTADQIPLVKPSSDIVGTALQVMINRNGKPYSAAAILEAALRCSPQLLEASPSTLEAIKSFTETHLPKLVSSPSSSYLVSALGQFRLIAGQQTVYRNTWQAAIDGLLAAPKDLQRQKIIGALISLNDITDLVRGDQALQDFLLETSSEVVEGNNEGWPLFEAAVIFGQFSKSTEQLLLQSLISALSASNPSINLVFEALELFSKKRPEAVREEDVHGNLVTKLLALTELSDSELVKRATNLRSSVDNKTEFSTSSVVHILKENLENAGPQSLAINTLVQQAKEILATSGETSLHPELFPDVTKWSRALTPLLNPAPNSTLGVMRPFAGAVFLVRAQQDTIISRPSRDLDGYSVALRMAMYSARLIRDHSSRVSKDTLVEVIYLVSLTAELANDQLDLLEDNKLFTFSSEKGIAGVREFVDKIYQESSSFILLHSKAWRDGFESGSPLEFSGVVHALILKLVNSSHGNTSTSFYSARVLSHLLPKLVEQHGWQSAGSEEWLSSLEVLKSSTSNILGAVAILTGLHEPLSTSQLVSNLCNRIISDVASANAQSEKTLGSIVLLNAALSIYDDADLPVAQNRLVFAVKQILSWTPDIVDTNYQLSSESCLALQRLLPAIKSVYGSYWENTLQFCIKIWESMDSEEHYEHKISMMGMSLKLFSNLRGLQDANDDLEDALTQYGETASHCLIKLMKLPRSKRTQPLEFVDNILSRLVVKIPSSHIKDVSEFYPLVASENTMIQSTAFDVLHRAIPAEQEEISVNTLLEKKDAKLPEELLSLLLDAPSFRNFDDEELAAFPPSIRCYLLSWHLVYDSFSTASWKVRKDYYSHLQSENCMGSFLTFLFDVLGHSDGMPLNLAKAHFDESYIRTYDTSLADAEPNERNLQWLLIHLYHLCLKHTGDLVKNWFSECQNKQTRQAVETWTEKYFTPLLISDKLDEIDKWASSKEAKEGGEKELEIKASKSTRSVFASYEIDDTSVQIAIRFPPNYPFYNVKVEGINRVAVPEKEWQSWLLIVQGVITFSNGSLIDGLTVFRRKIEDNLKGHTECMICVSIISIDKKTPDKRCGTCKNAFHGHCLFKWFASSNQSLCPLCRCAFNYGR